MKSPRPRTAEFLAEVVAAPRSWGASLIVSAVLVGSSALLRLLLNEHFGGGAPFVTFSWAVLLAAVFGGLRAAAATLAISNLTGWFIFAEPEFSFEPMNRSDATHLVFFDLFASLEAGLAATLRQVLLQLRERNRELSAAAEELNHRVKNNLATVLSLAAQTAKTAKGVPDFLSRFTGRIQALSRSNELVARKRWADVELNEIVAAAMRPFNPASPATFSGTPDDLKVSSRAAVSLALILHEFATNAAKFGALSDGTGRLLIEWRRIDPVHGLLTWTEETGRPIEPPTGAGFGTTLIHRLSAGDLGGEAKVEYRPDGVRAEIRFKLRGATA